jgi:ABC-type bacteriocin/lantibiotic exporter with double-glycine peptidase domain
MKSTPARLSGRYGSRLRLALSLLSSTERGRLAVLVVLRAGVGLCDLLLAGAMYLVFVRLQGSAPRQHFWWMPGTTLSAAIVTAVLVVLRSVADVASTRAVTTYVQAINNRLLLRLAQGYSEMDWRFFIARNRSELLNHTTYTAREASHFYHRGIELISASLTIVMMTVALVYQNAMAAFALALVIGAFYLAHRFLIRRQLQVAGIAREEATQGLQKILADVFASGKEIRAYRNQVFFLRRINEQAQRVAASTVKVTLLPQIARIVSDQGVALLFLGVVIAVQLRHGEVSQLLSLLVFYFVLSRRLIPLISQVSFIAGQMEGSYENVRVASEELKTCSLHRAEAAPIALPEDGTAMQLDHIAFSFDAGVPVLRDIVLTHQLSELIVVHGASGAGKSSLLNVIAGVLQPDGGAVCVDRSKVAYVPQDITLLDDSVRNNLLFGLVGKCDVELMEALRIAELDRFVMSQAEGIDSQVGDNGILFSGGQRQRLGLARAVLRGATLLLLDEATSALDEENEAQVLSNLRRHGVAVLLVTHRMRAQLFADRVFTLHGGRLLEELPQVNPFSTRGFPGGIYGADLQAEIGTKR